MSNDEEKISFIASLPPIQLERIFLGRSKDRIIREVLVFDLCGWGQWTKLEPLCGYK